MRHTITRAMLWLLVLLACAVALVLFMSANQGVITLFWPPWRVDVSANLVLLLALAALALLHASRAVLHCIRRLAAPRRMAPSAPAPEAPESLLAQAWAHHLAGRASQARQAAASALAAAGAQDWALQAQAHLMAAACEADASQRQPHWQAAQAALAQLLPPAASDKTETAAATAAPADTVPAGRRVVAAGS